MQKRAEMELRTIAKWIIALVVLIIVVVIFFGPNKLIAAVAGTVEDWSNKVLGGIKKEQPIVKQEIPPEVLATYNSIRNAFLNNGKQCIINYKSLATNSGDYTIKISNVFEPKPGIFIQLISSKAISGKQSEQILKYETLENKAVCVVIFKNTDLNFVFNDLVKRGEPFINQLSYKDEDIEITRESRLKGGKIVILVNGKWYDMEDRGILYKPDENRVCFIPTRNGGFSCAVDNEGILDDDCINKMTETAPFCKIST